MNPCQITQRITSIQHPSTTDSISSDTVDLIADSTLQTVLRPKKQGKIQFGRVKTLAELEEVGHFRRKQYDGALPYMRAALREDGIDDNDSKSTIYVVRRSGDIVGTVRLCESSFEVLNHVSESHVDRFLGEGWKRSTIEWGRLIVDRASRIEGLLSGLVAYASLDMLLRTHYRAFFGYAVPKVQRVLDRFSIQVDPEPFQIASRGDHRYNLISGSFERSLVSIHLRNRKEVRTHEVRPGA